MEPQFTAFALAHVALGIHFDLGHDEQRNAAGTFGRVGQAGQHDVHDVFGQVVFTGGDENLGAGDLVAAVGLGHGLGLDLGQIGAALGFGQAHGARPLARHQLGQVGRLLRVGAVLHQGVDAAHAQAGVHGERPVGRAHHFRLEQVQRHGQALSTELGGERQTLPATFHESLVGVFEAFGCGDHTVFKVAAFNVAGMVQRCQHLFAQLGGTVQNGVDHLRVGILAVGQRSVVGGVVQHFVHQEAHVAQGSFVLGHGDCSPRVDD